MRTLPLLLAALGSATAAAGDATLWDRLQIHGFASTTMVNTTANNYYGRGEDWTVDFTELGLNASYQLNQRILLAAQALGRRAGKMYDGSPSLDYALADLSILSATDHSVGVRLGRIKNPLGLYNETRDVPFTRPGIFLPQTVYYDKIRNLLLSSDGAMLHADSFGSLGEPVAGGGGGQAVVDENVEWTYLGYDYPGAMKPDGITWIGSLWYSTPDESLRAGISGAKGELRYDFPAGWFLGPGEIDYLYWVASLQYNSEDLTLSAEYSRVPVEWRNFGPVFPLQDQTAEGYYFQAAYRLRPNLELMVRYEEGFADRDDRSGKFASALTGTPAFDFFTKIFTAGIRWDVFPNLMLRAEYQRHDGTLATSIRENPDPGQIEQHWSAFALSVSVRF